MASHRPTVRITRPAGNSAGNRCRASLAQARVSKSGSSPQGRTRTFSGGTPCNETTIIRRCAARRQHHSRMLQRSPPQAARAAPTLPSPWVQMMLFIRGASNVHRAHNRRQVWMHRQHQLRLAAAPPSAPPPQIAPCLAPHPVNTNSRSPTRIRCNSCVSFKLSRRYSIFLAAAYSLSTNAICRPARWIPPGASSSGNSPISTR